MGVRARCLLVLLICILAASSWATAPDSHSSRASTQPYLDIQRQVPTRYSPGSSHVTKFGEQISDAECQAVDTKGHLEQLMRREKLPYAFVGPAEACDAEGCTHPYWGSRCRFESKVQPACSKEDIDSMLGWMVERAQDGADWAKHSLGLLPCQLWSLLRGRTTWLAGDSISQDMAFGLSCFLVEYYDPMPGKKLAEDAAVMRSLTHSASGKEMTTWCFNMTAGTRICSLRANKAPRMGNVILELLPSIADAENDILIMNFGAWYNDFDELTADLPRFKESLQQHRSRLPKRLFWRESTAQHFDTPTGYFDYSKQIVEQRCKPAGSVLGISLELDANRTLKLAQDSAQPNDAYEYEILTTGGHRNRLTQPLMDELGIATLPAWNLTLMVDTVHKDYHREDSGGMCVYVDCDCSHACSPSWYQMLLGDFYWALQQHNMQTALQCKKEERTKQALSC